MNVTFPGREDRAKVFAIFGMCAGAGAATGLLLGGVLTESLSWRWCFFICLPVALIAGVIAVPCFASLPGAQRQNGMRDLLGLVLGSGSVFSFVLGLSEADGKGWGNPVVITMLMMGLVLVCLFFIWEKLVFNPMLPLRILGDPVRGASYLSIAGVGIAQMGSSIYLTYYFQEQLGYSPVKTGLMFMPLILGLMAAAVVSMRFLVPWLGLGAVYSSGAFCQAVGFLMLGTLGAGSVFGETMRLPLVVSGIGIGLVMAPAMSFATAGTTAAHSGIASAVANTSQQLGASLGVAFLSTWASRHAVEGLESRAAEAGC